ncbi:MAG: beta strand repeat-containing protein, partial [Gemmataceae bacterium]
MPNAFSLFRSFLTGKLFPRLTKARNKRSFRPDLLTLESRVTPAIVDLSGSTGWTPIMIGATKDYPNDSLALAPDTDIIADGTHGSLYTAFDDNNTPGTADDSLVFRMRINNPTSTTNFAGVAIVGMDANMDGRVDIFMAVDGRNNGQAIRLFDPGTGLNTSPSTTSTSPLPVGFLPNNGVYPFSASNYSIDAVSSTSDPNWNGQTDGLNGYTDGKNDAFISWRLPIADLSTVLAKPSPVDRAGNYGPRGVTGIAGFNKDTVVQYVNFTQTQTGPINGDLNGAPRNYDGAFTFSALGASTAPMSASNPVPASTVVNISEPIGDGNLSATESTAVTISGTTNAAAGSTIQLTISDTNGSTTDVTTTATVVVGSNGVNTWSVANVNVSSQVDGNLTVTASVTVNSVTSTDTAVVALDKTAPSITINTLPTAISGKPTFTGTTDLPAGSTLTVTIDPDNDPTTNNNIVYTTSVLSGGTWSLNTSLQAPSSGTMPVNGLTSYSKVTISGSDPAGNQSTATILNKPTVYTLSTNDTTPLVGGTWTNLIGDSLAVTVDAVSYTPVISGNIWTVQVTNALAAGSSYEVVATVTRTSVSTSVTDATTGELTINSNPVIAIGINGGASVTTFNTLPTITGTSSNYINSTIILRIDPNNDGNMTDAVTYSVTTDSSGNWSLNTGDNTKLISGSIPLTGYSGTIHAYAENLAGTATAEQVLTISTPTVVISSIISAATTNSFATVNNTGAAANYLNMTEDDSVTVTGTAPNGYTVDLLIKDPNGNFLSQNGISVSGGNWSVTGLNLSTLDDG